MVNDHGYSQYTVDDYLLDLAELARTSTSTNQNQNQQHQQHQQHQHQQNKNNDDNTTTTTTGSSTTIHTEPRVSNVSMPRLWDDEAIDTIMEQYQKTIGTEMKLPIIDFLKRCMYMGMDWLVVLDAIEQTGWARNPTAYYMRAILQRYIDQGIRTLDDVMADKKQREQLRKKSSSDHRHDWFD